MSVLFKPGDILFFLLLIAAALFSFQWLFSQPVKTDTAILEIDGNVQYKFDLRQNETVRIETVPGVEFIVGEGTVKIHQNTCVRQICVKAGAIASPGQSIICVPRKILLYIPANERSKEPLKIITG